MTVDAIGWQPEPGWRPLTPGGSGCSTWLLQSDRGPVVVKRLVRPVAGDPSDLWHPSHVDFWRREAEVALSGSVADSRGLRGPEVLRVEEDAEGVTVWSARIEQAGNNGPYLARALGAFAGNPVPEVSWLARGMLRARLSRFEQRGGWPTLARTTLADVADHVWRRRAHHLAALERLPQVLSHGDPTPGNLLGREGDDVIAVDWSTLGVGAVGADLGYLALSVREDLEVLVGSYAEGSGLSTEQIREGAVVMACYTALSRAEWALARAATGPGALAGKYRHPAVAPYLRSLQRLFPALETLI